MRAALVAVALLFSVSAWAVPPGTLVITVDPVDATDPNFEKDVKRHEVHALEKSGDQWTLNFVAFLKKAAGSKLVQLVFYDTAVKKHEPTNNFPIRTQPSAKILTSSVSFNPDQGFKAGHRYNVLITRLIGGREEVYARSTLTLK
jgi:hypothetical protein